MADNPGCCYKWLWVDHGGLEIDERLAFDLFQHWFGHSAETALALGEDRQNCST